MHFSDAGPIGGNFEAVRRIREEVNEITERNYKAVLVVVNHDSLRAHAYWNWPDYGNFAIMPGEKEEYTYYSVLHKGLGHLGLA